MICTILKLLNTKNYILKKSKNIQNLLKIKKNNKIAVIGSSSKLLQKKYGSKIDNHDVIIRFNRAPTKGFKKHVGSKTTLRFINEHTFQGIPYGKYVKQKEAKFVKKLKNKNICVIVEGNLSKIQRNKYLYSNRTNNILFLENKLNHFLRFAIISDFNFFKKIYYYKYKPNFTTGMFVIALMTIFKKKVSVYGFDKDKKNNNYGQYWKKTETNTIHDYEEESNIIKMLIKKNKISFFG
jgi:hypothetical protein